MDMTALISAAATAAGPAPAHPEEMGAWRSRVLGIASDLAMMTEGIQKREARKRGEGFAENDRVTSFHAKLRKVEKITKGSGERTVTKGLLSLEAHASSNVNSDGFETIETAPLGTPEGDEEFARAQMLVGQPVIIWKRNFLHPEDKSKKLKELTAIEAANAFSTAPVPVERAPADPASGLATRLATARASLAGLSDESKVSFRDWLTSQNLSLKSGEWSEGDLTQVEAWVHGI